MKSDYSTFSNDKKLQSHINKHLQEYPNFTKNDYVKKAHNLLKAKPNEHTEGFYSENGFLFKYDII